MRPLVLSNIALTKLQQNLEKNRNSPLTNPANLARRQCEQTEGKEMITLKNNFHNTCVRVRAGVEQVLTENQIRRIKRELCGIGYCKCGIVREDDYDLEFDGKNWTIITKHIWDDGV